MRLLVSLTDQSFHQTKSLGILNVSLGLTRALAHHRDIRELHVLCNREWSDTLKSVSDKIILHGEDRPVPRHLQRVLWDQIGVVRAIKRINPDWALLPKGFAPVLPTGPSTRVACYMHDVIWEYYLNREIRSEEGKTTNPFPFLERHYFPVLGRMTLRKADLILTSTAFNQSRFLHYAPSAKVEAVGIGFPQAPLPLVDERGNGILLFVSRYPHKLTHLAIDRLTKWADARADKPPVHLIGSLPEDLQRVTDERGWIRHGRISQQRLDEIMQKECKVAVYFSDYEGFGMPPVECWLYGLPCLSSDIPAIRENLPGQLLFANNDRAGFEQKLTSLYDQPACLPSPNFPSWNTVADRCLHAMQAQQA